MPPPRANLLPPPSQAHHAETAPAAAPLQHQTPQQQSPPSQKQYKTKTHPPTKADLLLSPAHIVPAKPLSALSDGEARGLVALMRGRIGAVDLNLVVRDGEGEKGFWGGLWGGKFGRREGGGKGDGEEEQRSWLKVGMWEYGLVREMDAGGRVRARCGEGGRRRFAGEWVAAVLVVLICVGLVLRVVRLRWYRGRGRFGGVGDSELGGEE